MIQLAVNPNTPSPSANKIIFASIEEISDAVAGCGYQRPGVIAQVGVGIDEFGFAPFVVGVVER